MRILNEGTDINSEDEEGRTPLLLASKNGHMEVVQYLVENGADMTRVAKVR